MKSRILALTLLVLAPGCAAVKGWLANGPEIELAASLGPAKFGLTLNPGKTVVDAATALANAGESLAGVTGAIDAVPEPETGTVTSAEPAK